MLPRTNRVAVLFAGGALILRALSLCRRPLWFDEIFTLWLARQPPHEVVGHLRFDSGPPLFYLLAMPFARIGEVLSFDAASRLLSFAAAGLLFWRMGPRYSGGARFVVLVAASPLLFFYAGEARPYAMLAAFSFLLFLATFRARDTETCRLAAALIAAVLPWIHYLGGLVVLGSAVLCAIRRRWTSASLQIAASSLFLIWLPIAAKQPALSVAWNRSTVSSFLRAPEAFGFWGELPAYFSGWKVPAAWAGSVIGFGLLLFAFAGARRSRAVRDALAFSLLPLGLALVTGLFYPVYFPGRTEMMTLPVALWAFARASRRSKAVRALTVVAAISGGFLIAGGLLHGPGPFPYSRTAGFVTFRGRPGDLVVAGDSNYLPLRLAKDRGMLAADLIGLPAEIELHPGWFETPSRLDPEIDRLRRKLAEVRPRGRVDFAIPPDPVLRGLAERLVGGEPRRVLQPPEGYAVLEIER